MPVTWSSVTSILQRRKTSFNTFIYYIDTDEIPGFFLLLKTHIFIARSEDTIFIFHMWGYWCHHGIFLFFIRILTFWNRKYKYYCLYFSFITLYPSFIAFLWQAFCDRWPLSNCTILLFQKWIIKKSCFLCRNFITIYKINRTLHGRLGIRILSSHAERISWTHSLRSLVRETFSTWR